MEVDHHKSPFSLDVQRSKYISVDTDVMDNKKFTMQDQSFKGPNASIAKSSLLANKNDIINNLAVKYCVPRIINR
jgi:hypothetical protein